MLNCLLKNKQKKHFYVDPKITKSKKLKRYFYKLRDRKDVKDKNIFIQRTLNSLKGTWLNCNSKLVLIPGKNLYVILSRFYVISWNDNKAEPLT